MALTPPPGGLPVLIEHFNRQQDRISLDWHKGKQNLSLGVGLLVTERLLHNSICAARLREDIQVAGQHYSVAVDIKKPDFSSGSFTPDDRFGEQQANPITALGNWNRIVEVASAVAREVTEPGISNRLCQLSDAAC